MIILLYQQGVKVFKSQAKTVEDNLNLFLEGKLKEMPMTEVCDSHHHIHLDGQGHDCCSSGH